MFSVLCSPGACMFPDFWVAMQCFKEYFGSTMFLYMCYVLPREVTTQGSFCTASYPWAARLLDGLTPRTEMGWHGQS